MGAGIESFWLILWCFIIVLIDLSYSCCAVDYILRLLRELVDHILSLGFHATESTRDVISNIAQEVFRGIVPEVLCIGRVGIDIDINTGSGHYGSDLRSNVFCIDVDISDTAEQIINLGLRLFAQILNFLAEDAATAKLEHPSLFSWYHRLAAHTGALVAKHFRTGCASKRTH